MLTDELNTYLLSSGANLVGFANLREIDPNLRDNLPFGVIIGVSLNPKIISEIGEGPTRAYVEECQRADILLNILGQATNQFLSQRGNKAQPRTITGAEYPDTLTTKLPHKTAATRAGLGWVGKNALLVTEEVWLRYQTGKYPDQYRASRRDTNKCVSMRRLYCLRRYLPGSGTVWKALACWCEARLFG